MSAAKTSVVSADKRSAVCQEGSEEKMSWQTADLLPADTADVLAADTRDVLLTDITHILAADKGEWGEGGPGKSIRLSGEAITLLGGPTRLLDSN